MNNFIKISSICLKETIFFTFIIAIWLIILPKKPFIEDTIFDLWPYKLLYRRNGDVICAPSQSMLLRIFLCFIIARVLLINCCPVKKRYGVNCFIAFMSAYVFCCCALIDWPVRTFKVESFLTTLQGNRIEPLNQECKIQASFGTSAEEWPLFLPALVLVSPVTWKVTVFWKVLQRP